MKNELTIEDFKNTIYPIIKANRNILEVAQIMKHTMNRGCVFLPKHEIEFSPLTIDCYPMQVFSRIRSTSTPKLKDSDLGRVLVWDNYAIRIRK